MKCIDADIFRKKAMDVDPLYNHSENTIKFEPRELLDYLNKMNVLRKKHTNVSDQSDTEGNVEKLVNSISGLKEIYVVSEYWVCIKEPFKERSDEEEYMKTMKDPKRLNKPELCICNIDNISNREKSPITFDIFTQIGKGAPYIVDEQDDRIYHYFYTKDRIEYSGGNLPTTNTTIKHHKKYTYKKHTTI